MRGKEEITKLLSEDVVSVICELGKAKGVLSFEREHYEHLSHYPLVVNVPNAHPNAYYTAHRWLDRHRDALKERIVGEFKYMAKRQEYPRGKEVQLVLDLAEAIQPVVGNDVDPALVATVLLKEGLDDLCVDRVTVDGQVASAVERLSSGKYDEETLGILRRALDLNPNHAEANYYYGSVLLFTGKWHDAITYFEKSISSNPAGFHALNDVAYIYSEHAEEPRKGFDYAKRALSMTWKGSPEEPAILDTVGWAYYQIEHNPSEAEECLTESRQLTGREHQFYITVSYHLMAVLVHQGSVEKARQIFEELAGLTPQNPWDSESYEKAKKLLAATK